ncbi:MAG: PilZ domain-containing protein [Deltaproteobacteria bacterium]|nr:PilZ domain-containing protein [Deltaproteobacteria bacterium]
MHHADSPERRRSSRYQAPGGTSVHVRTPVSAFAGFLVDLSLDGAAFEYVFLGETLQDGDCIDICSDKDQLRIENLPFKRVSDVEVSDPGPEPVVWRRAGIVFTSLSEEQRRQLTELIRQWGHRVPTAALAPVTEPAEGGEIGDQIFLSRLKLLNIAAKAYLGGYPYGFYRESAVARNAKEILRLLTRQNVFRFGDAHGALLEKHIIRLSTAFSDFPVKADGPTPLEESIDCIGDYLRVDKGLKQMAFLKVA